MCWKTDIELNGWYRKKVIIPDAEVIAEYYYVNYVSKGISNGGPGEILQLRCLLRRKAAYNRIFPYRPCNTGDCCAARPAARNMIFGCNYK